MYQEVFVFVAVNPGEASGERDIDFSLYDYIVVYTVSCCLQTYSILRQYLIICWTARGHSVFVRYADLRVARIRLCKIQTVLFSHPTSFHLSAEKRHAHKGTVTSSSILFNEIHPKKWKQPFHRWQYKSETSFPGGVKREIRYSAERCAMLRGEITIKGRSTVWNNSCIFHRAEMFLCDTFPRPGVFHTITRDDDIARHNAVVMEAPTVYGQSR